MPYKLYDRKRGASWQVNSKKIVQVNFEKMIKCNGKMLIEVCD
jgi:hypothetical protein